MLCVIHCTRSIWFQLWCWGNSRRPKGMAITTDNFITDWSFPYLNTNRLVACPFPEYVDGFGARSQLSENVVGLFSDITIEDWWTRNRTRAMNPIIQLNVTFLSLKSGTIHTIKLQTSLKEERLFFSWKLSNKALFWITTDLTLRDALISTNCVVRWPHTG